MWFKTRLFYLFSKCEAQRVSFVSIQVSTLTNGDRTLQNEPGTLFLLINYSNKFVHPLKIELLAYVRLRPTRERKPLRRGAMASPDIAVILDNSKELDKLRKEQDEVLLEINKLHKKIQSSEYL